MQYKECPYCGSNLDPGEKCDCTKEKGLADANQHSPNPKNNYKHSISEKDQKIKSENPLRDLRISKSIQTREMVKTVRAIYPKYDKMLQSKCEHGEKYGIDLKPAAMDALIQKYAPELLEKVRHQRGGCHRLKCRVSCRLEDDEYAAVVQRVKDDGFDTVQAWLSFRIRAYLKTDPVNMN